MNEAEVANGRIVAVTAQHTRTGQRLRLTGRLFADGTGDGALGALAGADCEMTVPGRRNGKGRRTSTTVVPADHGSTHPNGHRRQHRPARPALGA